LAVRVVTALAIFAAGTLARPPDSGASVVAIPAAAIVHTTATLVAPAPGSGRLRPEITVGVRTQNRAGVEVTIARRHSSNASYALSAAGHSQGITETTSRPVPGLRAGDRILVRLAVSQLAPARGAGIGTVIAVRALDLRTGRTLISLGRSGLLAGAAGLPPATGTEDIAVTVATWARTWAGTGATLDNRDATGTLTGVAQWGRDFFVTDRAHPHKGVPVGTAHLHPKLGDRIVVTATTGTSGSHTDVVIVDRRNTHAVSAAC
jgi:hypothetical protein